MPEHSILFKNMYIRGDQYITDGCPIFTSVVVDQTINLVVELSELRPIFSILIEANHS